MKRILVTGIALARDPKLKAGGVSDYDLSWLFNYPSTLLWADKIIITPEILEIVKHSYYPGGSEDLGKAVKIIFERLEEDGLIETRTASDAIDKELSDEIFAQIEADRNRMSGKYPNTVRIGEQKGVPGQVFINNTHYCAPQLWSMYASFILAKEWNADLLLPRHDQKYFDWALSSVTYPEQCNPNEISAFDEIMKNKLPEIGLFPSILFDAEVCVKCPGNSNCNSNSLNYVEADIDTLMRWRSYDEIHELKKTVQRISKEANNSGATSSELVAAFKAEEKRLNKLIRSVFPKVERWSNMATALSVPAVVAGISTGSTSLAAIGAAVAGAATVTGKYVDIIRSKSRWVGHKVSKDA